MATKKPTAVNEEETANVPAVKAANAPVVYAGEDESDAGAGAENVTSKDIAIPELKLLQKMSPQVDKEDGKYIQGAEAGMFLDTNSRALFDGKQGVLFMPCYYSKHFVEFIPREQGGGFVADHGSEESNLPPTEIRKKDKGGDVRVIAESGNEVVETHQFAVLAVRPDGSFIPALLRFSSTKIKQAKRLNALTNQKRYPLEHPNEKLRGQRQPTWKFLYKLSSIVEENQYGKYYNIDINDHGELGKVFEESLSGMLYAAGKALYQGMKAGAVKTQGFGDDDIPFDN